MRCRENENINTFINTPTNLSETRPDLVFAVESFASAKNDFTGHGNFIFAEYLVCTGRLTVRVSVRQMSNIFHFSSVKRIEPKA